MGATRKSKTSQVQGTSRRSLRRGAGILPLCLIFLLSACASGQTTLTDPERDPWEGFNRGVHNFNMGFDKAIFRPVAKGL